MSHYTYQPAKFYWLTLGLTWAIWFAAAYCSYQPELEGIHILFIVAGTFVPFVLSLFMIYRSGNKDLKADFSNRLVSVKRIRLSYTPVIFLLMPASIMLATAISLLYGQSATQFEFSELNVMGLVISILAPLTEELGWRGYGVDSLRAKSSLFKTSLLFALLWSVWHVPLFFVNDYYQNELWHSGIPYVLNFFISLVPVAFISNWLYYKNGRSVLAVALFHIIMVLSAELWRTVDSTKFVQTAILVLVAVGIVLYDKAFFYERSALNLDGVRRSA
ncbi:MAG TPA: CPBP family intramembrane glutamic endopeptidase [Symbiobacteriaceae bacterium]|nr:CPBP family intramembrane glutamic endopeptidase [Symbiobacteriaceae bacterium]